MRSAVCWGGGCPDCCIPALLTPNGFSQQVFELPQGKVPVNPGVTQLAPAEPHCSFLSILLFLVVTDKELDNHPT